MADGQQTFDSVQDFVAHRSEQRAAAREAAGISEEEYNEDGAEEAADTEDEIEAVADDVTDDGDTAEADPALADAEDDPETDNVDGDVDGGQESEPAEPTIAAPQYLGKDERELFEKLPNDAKKLVADIEEKGRTFYTRKSKELDATRQAFEHRMQGLDGFITETERQLNEYEQVDWEAAAQQLDPRDYQAHQARYQTLKQQMQEASSKRSEAEKLELREYTRAQSEILQQMAEKDDTAKALISREGGQKRMNDLKEYLKGQGIDDSTLLWASAPAVVLGYKAMKFDEAQKKAKQKPLPQKKPAGKTVAPATTGAAPTSTGKEIQKLSNKQELSPAEFKRLMQLRRKQKAS